MGLESLSIGDLRQLQFCIQYQREILRLEAKLETSSEKKTTAPTAPTGDSTKLRLQYYIKRRDATGETSNKIVSEALKASSASKETTLTELFKQSQELLEDKNSSAFHFRQISNREDMRAELIALESAESGEARAAEVCEQMETTPDPLINKQATDTWIQQSYSYGPCVLS